MSARSFAGFTGRSCHATLSRMAPYEQPFEPLFARHRKDDGTNGCSYCAAQGMPDHRSGLIASSSAGHAALLRSGLVATGSGSPCRGVVAAYMEKSPELVAAMIGTWLAGSTLVPILPDVLESREASP